MDTWLSVPTGIPKQILEDAHARKIANLGHEVSRGTIANILKAHGIDSAPQRGKHTSWRDFLATHWEVLVAADLFSVEVWSMAGLVRHSVLLVMELSTRRFAWQRNLPFGQQNVICGKEATSMIQPETSTTSPQTESATAIDTQWGRDKNARFTKGHRFGFQPGQSGNPDGRPPEVRYISEYMRDLLVLTVPELKKVAEEPNAPSSLCIAARILLDAVSGEGGHVTVRARDQVMNRLEGRPCQAVQITGPEEVVVNQIVGPDGPAKIVWADKSRLIESDGR